MKIMKANKKHFVQFSEKGKSKIRVTEKIVLAERGFDPRTSGLWAQHATTAPLCFYMSSYRPVVTQ